MTAPVTYRRPLPLVAVVGPFLALLFALLVGLAHPGAQQGWWDFATGTSLIRWGAYGGLVAAILSLVGALATRPGTGRRGFVLCVLGALVGLALFVLPLAVRRAMTPPAPPAVGGTTTAR
ncbi:MAG: hypothetical protein ACJ79S_11830 [Gemmatimonadaceae bacterium]